jgi:2-oxo-4-hydroxy-4-carboxy-5-ureidoimidazoline decarboxylase
VSAVTETRLRAEAVQRLNELSEDAARQALQRCCGAARWVDGMLAARPFASPSALLAQAHDLWNALEVNDWLEAFAHHPEIGADLKELRKRFARTAELSEAEQAGAAQASDATLLSLRRQNQAYRERFGYSFIVCASGKTAEEMLALLEQRLKSSPEAELGVAAAEQAKITRLRLEKI